ncbi:hypothetical protein MMC11_006116 [Xylographa trunciseda]|nr:hypothetical protein [Xylographa trunciseda]
MESYPRKRRASEAFESQYNTRVPEETTSVINDIQAKHSNTAASKSNIPNDELVVPRIMDPFKYLGDDEIKLIIIFLPARDTETLRRVSKLWKACSEFHNGGEALVRHFGHVGVTPRTFDTPEEANLAFRRRLCHQENLRIGKATSSSRVSRIRSWDIKNGNFMWAKWSIIRIQSVQTLNSALPIYRIKAHELLRPGGRFWDSCLTDSGDVVIAHDVWPSPGEEHGFRATHLLMVSPEGKVLLRFRKYDRNEHSISLIHSIASRGSRLYTLELLPTSSQGENVKAIFIARDLISGEILYQHLLSLLLYVRFKDAVQGVRYGSMKISSSGDWAMVTGGHFTFLINTGNGKEAQIEGGPSRRLNSYFGQGGKEVWFTRSDYALSGNICRYTYDAATNTWAATDLNIFSRTPTPLMTSAEVIDPDRRIFFRLQHEPFTDPRVGQRIVTSITTGQCPEGPKDYMLMQGGDAQKFEPEKTTTVSLWGENLDEVAPDEDDLDISLRWSYSAHDDEQARPWRTLSMVDDCLIMTNSVKWYLNVMNFWPSW